MKWAEIKDRVSTVGLWIDVGGFGDRIQYCSLPENFYRNTGLKLNFPLPMDCFYYNPFINFSKNDVDLIIDPWYCTMTLTKTGEKFKYEPRKQYRSLAEKHLPFDDFKLFLNRPRLYVFEELPASNLAVIHRTGRTVGELPDEIASFVAAKYKAKGYNVAQIGGKQDKLINDVTDLRGLDLFHTAHAVAQSSIFIGLNSGMYHLASCYNVLKKVILNQYVNDEQLENFFPCGFGGRFEEYTEENYPKNSIWLEFNAEYYNLTDRDVGLTRSILHI